MFAMAPKVLLTILKEWQLSNPKISIDLLDLLAEGDLWHLHTHQIWQNNDNMVTMDFL